MTAMLGFAAGVMIAASFWSLLAPAIQLSENNRIGDWFPAACGFLAGAIFLRLVDKILPHLHIGLPKDQAEGIKTSWHSTTLLVLAITLHNIPEGLAIGVAFGALASGGPLSSLPAAIALAVGIGIQNFPEGFATFIAALDEIALGIPIALAIAIHNIPEGMAVSLPIYHATGDRKRAFYYAFSSGLA